MLNYKTSCTGDLSDVYFLDYLMKSSKTISKCICKRMIHVCIFTCSNGRISDLGVRHVIDSPSGPFLRELNLTNCYKISDVTILRLSQR